MASIHDILRPRVVARLVSQIAATTNSVLNFMGMQPGGPNEYVVGGRSGTFEVFNNVRTAGWGRAPGTAAANRARNSVGRVPFTFPRHHEAVYLLAEEIHNFARLGVSDAARDEMGADYLKKQMVPPAQRLGNWRTALVVGMLRDSLYLHTQGDVWYPSYTSSGNLAQINYQMPAGNKSQLDMLGDGDIIDVSWDNAGANIPKHLLDIDAAFQELWGGRLEHVHCTSTIWNHVVTNDYVAAGAGIANTPFETFKRKIGEGPDGRPINEKIGTIRAVPYVEFHISDSGLEIGAPGSETYTKHWEDTAAVFMGDPTNQNFEMLLGSEPIAEYENAPQVVKVGADSWTKTSFNPTGWEMFTLDNALPCNYIPKSVAYGTVVF